MSPEPFAFIIYRDHLAGKSVEQLAADLKIPRERVEARLQAARQYLSGERGRCARCGATLRRGSVCGACQAFFASLNGRPA